MMEGSTLNTTELDFNLAVIRLEGIVFGFLATCSSKSNSSCS